MSDVNPKRVSSAEEVCLIIEACGEAGVAELKFGDLYLRFGTKTEPEHQTTHVLTPRVLGTSKKASSPEPAAEIAATQSEMAEKSLLADEIALREQELAEMFLTDPARAEELLMQGELTDDEEDEA